VTDNIIDETYKIAIQKSIMNCVGRCYEDLRKKTVLFFELHANDAAKKDLEDLIDELIEMHEPIVQCALERIEMLLVRDL